MADRFPSLEDFDSGGKLIKSLSFGLLDGYDIQWGLFIDNMVYI